MCKQTQKPDGKADMQVAENAYKVEEDGEPINRNVIHASKVAESQLKVGKIADGQIESFQIEDVEIEEAQIVNTKTDNGQTENAQIKNNQIKNTETEPSLEESSNSHQGEPDALQHTSGIAQQGILPKFKDSNDALTELLADKLSAGSERRLHPLSWLFILFDNLVSYSIPIALYVFFGPDDMGFGRLAPLLVLLLFVGAFLPIAHFLTYRFAIQDGEIRIRWGILNKQTRHIRLNKIHNVSLRRNLLHRMLDVAEVRLESAGSGAESEALLRVLSMSDASSLEQIIEGGAQAHDVAKGGFDAAQHVPLDATMPPLLPSQVGQVVHMQTKRTLLELTDADIVRFGLISNTGIVLGGVLTVFFSPEQLFTWLLQSSFFALNLEEVGAWSLGGWLFAAAVLGAFIVIGGKVVSVLSAFITHYGFRLTDSSGLANRHVTVEKGLFTRAKSHVSLDKVQVWRIGQTWLHRLFKRQSVHIDTAMLAGQGGKSEEGRASDEIIPLATPQVVQRLLLHLSGARVAEFHYVPVHKKAWRRLFWRALLYHAAIAGLITVFAYTKQLVSLPFLLGLLWLAAALPWILLASRRRADFMGLMVSPDFIAWRDGWLNKQWYVAQTEHVHGLSLSQTPFDRRYGMATLTADTVGGRLFGARFHCPYLTCDAAIAAFNLVRARCAT